MSHVGGVSHVSHVINMNDHHDQHSSPSVAHTARHPGTKRNPLVLGEKETKSRSPEGDSNRRW